MINFDSKNILNVTLAKLLQTDFTQFASASLAFEYICKSIHEATEIERVSVWDLKSDRIESNCLLENGKIVKVKTTLSEKEYPLYFQAVKTSLPIVASDVIRNKNTRELKNNYLEPLGISSMLDVPIHEKGKQTGVLCCEHRGEQRIWKESEVYFVSQVAGLISLVKTLFKVEKTKVELKEERLLLKAIVNNLPFHVFVKDKNHKWILSNDATVKYTGAASESEILGKENVEILRDAAEKTRIENEEILKTGKPLINKETFHVRPADLRLRKFLVSKFPLGNVENEITGVIGLAEDITERAAIETQLRESEEQFRLIAENTSDGIIVMKGETITYCSPSYEKITGYSSNEILRFGKKDLLALVHPDDQDNTFRAYTEAIKKGERSLVLRQRVLNRAGEYRWRENTVNLIYTGSGEVDSAVVAIRDITESVESSLLIKENERLLSEILHSLTEAVWALDFASYTPTFLSKSFEKLFGFNLEEWKTKPEMWMEVIHPEDKPIIEKVLEDVKNRTFGNYTIRVFNKEGEIRWVENRGSVILDDLGRSKTILGMAVDITEKVETLKQLEKSEKQLSVILNSLDEIVWAVKLPSREPLFISDSFEKVFGVPSEMWYEDYGVWRNFTTEESEPVGKRMVKELFTVGHSKGLVKIKDANGNLKSLKCMAKYVYDKNGEVDMMLGISLDITTQINTQDMLKNSERNLSNILNALDEAVWATSIPDYIPLFVSKSYEEFYGYNLEEWRRDWLLWENAVHPDDKHLIANFKKKVYAFETATATCRIVKKNGEMRWLYNLAKTIKDERGKPYMLLGIAIDVTSEKENKKQLNEVKVQASKAEMARAELELKTLQMQMNPHFIFNSLNSIQSFILKNDVISTNDYLSKFASLIRSFLDSSRSVTIRLREEIKLLQLYVEMEQMRFGDKFDFKINVGPDVDSLMEVPSMMLQPFVENAINHGIRYKEVKGLIEITFELRENSLFCKIEDDGVGRARANEILEKNNKGYVSQSLKITAERFMTYNAIHKSNITYDVSNLTDEPGVKDVGTSVRVSFPLDTSLKDGD